MQSLFAQTAAVRDIQQVVADAHNVLERHCATDDPGTDYLRKIANARIAELQAILGECAGFGLTATIDDVLKPLYENFTRVAVELENELDKCAEIGDEIGQAELEALLLNRENALAALDDARVAGMLLMTHLQRVVNYSKLMSMKT